MSDCNGPSRQMTAMGKYKARNQDVALLSFTATLEGCLELINGAAIRSCVICEI